MTFTHGYLLGGLLLAGIPILLHLIMRQKPRRLPFPAFRFLRQRQRINQRKIRLQHLLLLLLRVLVIAALCVALARPRLVGGRFASGAEQPVAAVFVFDTSPSMEYTVAERTRLDEAKQRAREALDELAPGSRFAVFDTGDDGGGDDPGDEWIPDALVRARVEGLRIRPANAPLNRPIDRAFRLLQKAGDGADAPPRYLYVFSDRTRACWDVGAARTIQPVADVRCVFVDVGVDNPRDVAVDKLELEPPAVAPGGTVKVRATVRATGADCENELSCQLDPDPDGDRLPEKQFVRLAKGQSQVYTFALTAPAKPPGVAEAPFQVVVKLGTSDALPSNNVRFGTFMVRDKRKVLALTAEDRRDARVWRVAHEANETFECDVRTVAEADKLDAKELRRYKMICLFEVPRPPPALWERLANYVAAGGGLAVVPGGDEMLPGLDEFNKDGTAAKLLPATLRGLIKVPPLKPGAPWAGYGGQHPITAPMREWSRTTNSDFADPNKQPLTYGYWRVEPAKGATVIAAYDDEQKRPALLERDRGKGRVVLFTTPMSGREMEPNRPWHNYYNEESSFGLVLIDLVGKYLAGDSSALLELNYLCGQPVTVPTPPAPFAPPFTLHGPGLTPSESAVAAADGQPVLAITQTLGPGNFAVRDGKNHAFAGFSVNLRAEETDLDRVPVGEIEAVLGKDAVLPLDRKTSLHDALQNYSSPASVPGLLSRVPEWLNEYIPALLMAALLVFLMFESLLANLFYRRQAPTAAGSSGANGPRPEGALP